LKYCAIALICLLSLGGLLSCGIEAYYYIDYIPQGDYESTRAFINLPSGNTEGYNYFNNFIIFYRIYISASNIIPGPSLTGSGANTGRREINPALDSDYTGLWNLTDITSTSVNTSNLENTFSNRRYFLLTLENANINSVLGSSSLGGRLEIAFPPNPSDRPTLSIQGLGGQYYLQRAVENQNLNLSDLNPLPDRNFLNSAQLHDNANVTSGRNADVASNNNANSIYTYVSLYIAARGTSLEMPPRTIYSQPTFIGIFRLADF